MFIIGVLIGPALAILVADVVLKPGQIQLRWTWVAVAALMVLIVVMPFFVAELKFGLIIGLPLGLLLAATPIALLPVERTSGPGTRF